MEKSVRTSDLEVQHPSYLYTHAHIMVVGCGALGNEVLKNLALLGIGHIVVVDFDHVERHNLSRSVLFRESDCPKPDKSGSTDSEKSGAGHSTSRPKIEVVRQCSDEGRSKVEIVRQCSDEVRSKVEVVRQRLLELNPEIEITAVKGDIAHDVGLGLLGEMDVAIACTDNRLARFMLNRHCMRVGIPWIDGGITQDEGTARVFAPPGALLNHPAGNCYACNLGPEALRDLSFRMPCAGTVRRPTAGDSVPTNILTASVIAAVQVQEALKIIRGEGTSLCGKMAYYEGIHLTSKLVTIEAYDECCPEHERWEPISASTFDQDTTVAEVLASSTSDGERIYLRDDCFVDYIIDRQTDERHRVMLPGRKVAAYIDQHPQLGGRLLSDFYQHEFRTLGAEFPYPELTLRQLGIPDKDILRVGDQYISIL